MPWTLFLNLPKYKIALFVVIVHVLPLCFLAKNRQEKLPLTSPFPKPIVLHTYIPAPKEIPLAKESIQQKAPTLPKLTQKTPLKKEVVKGQKPVKKNAKVSNKVAMQEVDKIFSNIKKIQSTAPASHAIEMGEMPAEIQLTSKTQEKEKRDALFDYLQTIIELPKKGSIKLSFFVDLKGRISHLQIEEEGVEAENITYIKELFAHLTLPNEVVEPYTSTRETIYITLHGVAE